jgi:SAM-dependent methyltransferase
MTEPQFDTEALFCEDYLYFFATEEQARGDRSASEAGVAHRLLDLSPDSAVLDLACGHGRLANRLAERGCEVTGLDITPLFLDHARRDADRRGVSVDYVCGDMRRLPWSERFDAVLNWATAFGYFDDAGNKLVLSQVHRALRPGGRFALDVENYTTALRRKDPTVVERYSNLLVDHSRHDPLSGRTFVDRTLVRDGRVRHVPYSVRLFTFPEIKEWLLEVGFRDVTGHGDTGRPLTADDERMIVLAHR